MEEISKALDNEIKRLSPFYPTKRALLLPLLHVAQSIHGWLPEDVQELVASKLDLRKEHVVEVVSFYTMYNTEPVGKNHVQICNNIACWLRGSEDLIHYFENKYNVGLGETTKDGVFTLNEVECLGSCGTAPVCQINDDYYENLNKENFDKVLQELA